MESAGDAPLGEDPIKFQVLLDRLDDSVDTVGCFAPPNCKRLAELNCLEANVDGFGYLGDCISPSDRISEGVFVHTGDPIGIHQLETSVMSA